MLIYISLQSTFAIDNYITSVYAGIAVSYIRNARSTCICACFYPPLQIALWAYVLLAPVCLSVTFKSNMENTAGFVGHVAIQIEINKKKQMEYSQRQVTC